MDVITLLVATPMTEGRNEDAMAPDVFVGRFQHGIASGRDEIYIAKARLLPLLLRLAPDRARNLLLDG